MPEHWQDIYSEAAWRKIRAIAKPTLEARILHHGHDLLDVIGNAIGEYHALDKTDVRMLEPRRKSLLRIHAFADRYLCEIRRRGATPAVKQGRKACCDGRKTTLDDRLDVWIGSLKRRCLKKGAYLQNLKNDRYAIDPFRSVTRFRAYAASRMTKAPLPDGLLTLSPSTNLERVDPLHRNFEHDTNVDGSIADAKTAMSRTLLEWLREDSPLPFFLYLEGHPVCTDMQYLDYSHRLYKARSVMYGLREEVRRAWVRHGKLVAREVFSEAPPTPLTTRDLRGTKLGEAYVWLKDGALLMHPHISGKYHHSSFDSGRRVRCAGTVVAKDGILQRLDNNSGHYQPSDRHFLTLLEVLEREGVTDATSRVGTHCIHDRYYGHSFAGFASYSPSEYKERTRARSIDPFPTPPDVLAELQFHG